MITDIYIFQKEDRISKIEILISSKDQENILLIDIPTHIYVTQDEVDDVPISSLESVGEFLDYSTGKQYVVDNIGDMLGLKFDNYIWLKDSSEDFQSLSRQLSVWSILSNFKYNQELKGNIYSNLPILNLITHISRTSIRYSEYSTVILDLSICCTEDSTVSSDKSYAKFNRKSFDTEFENYISQLISREVEQERVNVEVYNASDISGLASVVARKISHTGCRILRYDNAPTLYEKSIIYVPEPDSYPSSLILVRDVLGMNIEVRNERPTFITTGDIVVVLGKDM